MSTVKRLVSGSASAWTRIIVSIGSQVAVIPLFLSKWDIFTYGTWIAIQAIITFCSTIDRGHNDFLEYEFMKLGNEKKERIKLFLGSGFYTIILLEAIQLVLIVGICWNLNLKTLIGSGGNQSPAFKNEIVLAVIINWTTWIFTNISGYFARCLFGFGYFPRMGWWNVALAIITAVSPLGSLLNNGGILEASIWCCAASSVLIGFQMLDIRRLLVKEDLIWNISSLRIGFVNLRISLGLSFRYFFENFRQQGIRILLAPLSGVAALAAFTTMRTGANMALQGLSTITNPMMPELMRFLRNKDQERTVASFDTIWLILIAILCPFVTVIQIIAPTLFHSWTHGKIAFDPLMFSLLSVGVLIYALGQPATAVVIGNNLVKSQIKISIITTAILITGLLFLIPRIHILGAAISLVAAEISAATLFCKSAKKWLLRNNLSWPKKSVNFGILSVLTSEICMILISLYPQFKFYTISLYAVLQGRIIMAYVRQLPKIALNKIAAMRLVILQVIQKVIGKTYPTR